MCLETELVGVRGGALGLGAIDEVAQDGPGDGLHRLAKSGVGDDPLPSVDDDFGHAVEGRH